MTLCLLGCPASSSSTGDDVQEPSRSASGQLEVLSPRRAQVVQGATLRVTGRSHGLSGSVQVRLKGGGGQLVHSEAPLSLDSAGQSGSFDLTLNIPHQPDVSQCVLEVFVVRSSDQAPDHVVELPLRLQ